MNSYLEKISSFKNLKDIISGRTLSSVRKAHSVRQEALLTSKKEAQQALRNFINFKANPDNLAEVGAKAARKNLSRIYRDRFKVEAASFKKSQEKVNSARNKTFGARAGIISGLTGVGASTVKQEK